VTTLSSKRLVQMGVVTLQGAVKIYTLQQQNNIYTTKLQQAQTY